ncbi:MAG: hypothetical protein JNL50_07280 [Phycisphaerae bacterium]|nr:hypothetical protein [Phycisphaerae bacterium]
MKAAIAFASILFANANITLADIPIKEYDENGTLLTPVQSAGTSDTIITLKSATRFVDILPPDNATTIPKITFEGGPETTPPLSRTIPA